MLAKLSWIHRPECSGCPGCSEDLASTLSMDATAYSAVA